MLPDKNQLDDELIEQVRGGSLDIPKLGEATYREADSLSDVLAALPGNEDTNERTNEHSQNREPDPISKIAQLAI